MNNIHQKKQQHDTRFYFEKHTMQSDAFKDVTGISR